MVKVSYKRSLRVSCERQPSLSANGNTEAASCNDKAEGGVVDGRPNSVLH